MLNMIGMNFKMVGGAVRDHILGIAAKDADFVVLGETEESMIARGFEKVGAAFPVFLHPETKDEYALARTEISTGPGYNDFEVVCNPWTTLEEDLQRRDFTINACAMDISGEIIYSPNAKEDFENKVIRAVSLKSFVEDPLRVLRAIRFAIRYAQLGFEIHPDTAKLMRIMIESKAIRDISDERLNTEFFKIMSEVKDELDYSMLLHLVREFKLTDPGFTGVFGILCMCLDAFKSNSSEQPWEVEPDFIVAAGVFYNEYFKMSIRDQVKAYIDKFHSHLPRLLAFNGTVKTAKSILEVTQAIRKSQFTHAHMSNGVNMVLRIWKLNKFQTQIFTYKLQDSFHYILAVMANVQFNSDLPPKIAVEVMTLRQAAILGIHL